MCIYQRQGSIIDYARQLFLKQMWKTDTRKIKINWSGLGKYSFSGIALIGNSDTARIFPVGAQACFFMGTQVFLCSFGLH